jgi:DNA-binding transcriptional MerR regulator
MADRSHLSIGEVLSLLQDDFPDVTISKIRFLESQGLLDPERTPSGYRKFYEGDIERLRWILRHQRDHFLPLKVIKDRLEESAARGLVVPPDEPMSAAEGAAAATGGEPSSPQHMSSAPAVEGEPAEGDDAFSPIPAAVRARPGRNLAGLPGADPTPAPAPVAAAAPAPAAAPPAPPASAPERAAAPEQTAEPAPAARPAPVGRPAPTMPRLPVPADTGDRTPLDGGVSGGSFSAEELIAATGLEPRDLADLTRFGLVVGRTVGGDTFYDEDALVAARSAAGFVKFGIEARHLRMYKVAAESEAGFMEQVVMPLLKQRNPTARQQAADTLGELARLGDLMRAALLRTALRDHTEPR